MSVTFYAPDVDAKSVQMGNATGRIVLGLLGFDTHYLEGRRSVSTLEHRLGAVTPTRIRSRAVAPRRISATEYDHGSPAARLTEIFERLRALCAAARQAGVPFIAWG